MPQTSRSELWPVLYHRNMKFGILETLELIGALGFFIYGMKVMSDSLQQVAGNKLRQVLRTMATNRYTGVLTGFLITAILQSSSATTVLTVSFVNAGLLTLIESAGIMMGANIGTTITGWLVSLIGFEVKIAHYALPIIALGAPMLFTSKHNTKKWGEVLIGFALLFLGLSALKDAVPDIRQNEAIMGFLKQFEVSTFLNRTLFVFVGALITVIMQSSSAAMSLTIVLASQGLPIEIAAAMILGENIGTTITAELASIVANVHAKRSARIHSMFNIVGVAWMLVAMPFVLQMLGKVLPVPESGDANKFTLAAFHTVFNFCNVILLIGFVPWLVKLATRSVKSKGEDDEEFRLEYIEAGVFNSPEIAVFESKKEVHKMGQIDLKLFRMIPDLINETERKSFDKKLKRIKKYEDITDRIELEIADYLTKVSEEPISEKTSLRIRNTLSIIQDMERIGDLCFQMGQTLQRKQELKAFFTPDMRTNLHRMAELIDASLVVMVDNLNKKEEDVTLDEASAAEEAVNQLRDELRASYFESFSEWEHKVESGIIYNDMVHSFEKIGDHCINVTESLIHIKTGLSSKPAGEEMRQA